MGTVTDLEEFRKRKQETADYVNLLQDSRPMTWEEWLEWLSVSGDSSLSEIVERQKALMQCGELVIQIVDFELVKNYGRFRFSHAFRRCLLRAELQGLARKYGFSNFDQWI